ncbi:hypothetical protein HMPREF9441_01136 [Paraprevotella clara YIT 11840]|uniref:Uncharacterized protein n=1 Tax=Paraprevotella clara YIT 11840 TaxID=762968 RepID=G5SNX5_9BACT|nr:hypothetical protein HMPREF9441_01136 [Paraprevotella clara YIT 11840]
MRYIRSCHVVSFYEDKSRQKKWGEQQNRTDFHLLLRSPFAIFVPTKIGCGSA